MNCRQSLLWNECVVGLVPKISIKSQLSTALTVLYAEICPDREIVTSDKKQVAQPDVQDGGPR